MKILMVNKFLHPNGGSETYMFKLGEQLQQMGHEVQYFGMEHEGRIVGNRVNAYTSDMDFHGGSKLAKLTYPIKTIYSVEARRKIRQVLDDFQPDVCHLNNFNYQLTPSIILEIRKWSKQAKKPCKIVYTAHDCQLICPNHLCMDYTTRQSCTKCLGGHYLNCIKGKCVHGSRVKSIIGALEAIIWNKTSVYNQIDKVICCSSFLKGMMDTNRRLAHKTVAIHNFVEKRETGNCSKQDYVIYAGRFSQEKGVSTLINICRNLPEIQFVFAGKGPLEALVNDVPNIRNVGFQDAENLQKLIAEAKLMVVPSECNENCPFSVMESQMYGTPVLGARIGGIPELIREGVTGELFESGNAVELREKLLDMWTKLTENENKRHYLLENVSFATADEYADTILKEIY